MKTLLIILSLIIVPGMMPGMAHAKGLGGAATEATQMMNNAELISTAKGALETARNSLETAYNTYQDLKQFAPGELTEMTGIPMEDLKTMAEAYEVFTEAESLYSHTIYKMNEVRSMSDQLGMPPSQILQIMAEEARARGGVYQRNYDKEVAKMEKARNISEAVSKSAQKVRKIDSTVGGVQFLASQNSQTQSILLSISDSISTANAMAAKRDQQQAEAEADGRDRLSRAQDEYQKAKQRAKGMLPMPNEVRLTK